jgi:hypothetical protein
MAEIVYSAQSATVRNAYREGGDLLLLDGCSLPDICVACGNPALGNVERKEFSKVSLWFYALPPFLDLVAELAFRNKFLFAFPFCPNCPPERLRLTPVRLDRKLVVLRGASQRVLDWLPPPPPEVAAERDQPWLHRKFRWLAR